ncbi:uncharacterized protein LOC123526286 isoform X1 [Mercenaria mercenaria]|uniref:uncharacterized protein LOC123526286 isoform X1 n=1 Tax=Mercenaria mercenaria TaxID=6596 RepID=UPI001E1D4186|nr:uncharacterized protein LOC123526286 isoform X1 [Mercenaria mercenaria]XP_045161313.1 uncharacterized protein LOC123526286 isoform X1 [Mercenaria mercenaria]
MENITYVFNISSEAATDVTVTGETSLRTSVTPNDITTVDQTITTTNEWLSTGSKLSGITGSSQSTENLTNWLGFTIQSDHYNEYDIYTFDYGDNYIYAAYTFEKPFYLYVWEFLVIFTFLVNLIVISVLLRRKVRNATNIVLAAIAISDSLTGLVTLPSYIMVYLKYVPPYGDYDYSSEQSTPGQYESGGYTSDSFYDDTQTQEPVGGCELTKDLCNGYMISKYFLSKSFHSMSIFLTLFLAIQRYISIRYPYRSQLLLNLPKIVICCVAIVLISPILHVYHLLGERAFDGKCQWELTEKGCGGGCMYLFITFFIRHLIPCVALVILTTLFILQLRSGERNLCRMDSSKSQISRRKEENRRISIIVTAVVLVFLIPEIPYGILLLYNAIDKATNQGRGMNLETNRALHLVYELLLVLSFHANFYVYTFFNRRFRKTLFRTYLKPVRRFLGDTDRLSVSTTSSVSRRTSNRKTDTGSAITQLEMHSMINTSPPGQPEIQTNSAASSLVEKDLTVFEGDCNL